MLKKQDEQNLTVIHNVEAYEIKIPSPITSHITRAKRSCVLFSDCSYQLWFFHLPLYQVPESHKELSSIMLHKHWTSRKHNLDQYYEQHPADFPQMAKGNSLSPIRSSLFFPCHSLPGTELRLDMSCNVSM